MQEVGMARRCRPQNGSLGDRALPGNGSLGDRALPKDGALRRRRPTLMQKLEEGIDVTIIKMIRNENGNEYGSLGDRALPEDCGFSETALPSRKKLPHGIPPWVNPESVFFITICCSKRRWNALCPDAVTANTLWESALFRQEELRHWWLHLFLLMPDHVHALISFSPEHGMKKTVTGWKKFTAGNFKIDWQRDFFDHRLRNRESFEEKALYIRKNPVRAGLVEKPEDWPYAWGYDSFGHEKSRDGTPLPSAR